MLHLTIIISVNLNIKKRVRHSRQFFLYGFLPTNLNENEHKNYFLTSQIDYLDSSIPRENIRKPLVFLIFSGEYRKRSSGMKYVEAIINLLRFVFCLLEAYLGPCQTYITLGFLAKISPLISKPVNLYVSNLIFMEEHRCQCSESPGMTHQCSPCRLHCISRSSHARCFIKKAVLKVTFQKKLCYLLH